MRLVDGELFPFLGGQKTAGSHLVDCSIDGLSRFARIADAPKIRVTARARLAASLTWVAISGARAVSVIGDYARFFGLVFGKSTIHCFSTILRFLWTCSSSGLSRMVPALPKNRIRIARSLDR